MAKPVFRAVDLCKRFAGVCAADNLSMSVEAGEFRAVIRPNGAGKSRLFDMITGFVTPDSGRIFFEDDDITGDPPHRLFHRGISRTFQITSILADLSVLENVQIALLSRDRKIFDFRSRAKSYHVEESCALLESVDLLRLRSLAAKTLAHGDQKRLELAVALANRPRLLLLDEPTAGMTARERVESIRMVHRIAKERGLTVISRSTTWRLFSLFRIASRFCIKAEIHGRHAGPTSAKLKRAGNIPRARNADRRIGRIKINGRET